MKVHFQDLKTGEMIEADGVEIVNGKLTPRLSPRQLRAMAAKRREQEMFEVAESFEGDQRTVSYEELCEYYAYSR